MMKNGFINLYYADVSPLYDETKYDELYALMPDFRKEKADRYVRFSDKCLSVGAWRLLQIALDALDIKCGEIAKSGAGKPYFSDGGICFNLSHSGDFVLCAVSDASVGCDIEKIKEDKLDIAKRFFCENEYKYIASLENDGECDKAFARIWTMKESLVKCTGKGLDLPGYDVCRDGTPCKFVEIDGNGFEITTLDVVDGYAVTVCGNGTVSTERVEL